MSLDSATRDAVIKHLKIKSLTHALNNKRAQKNTLQDEVNAIEQELKDVKRGLAYFDK